MDKLCVLYHGVSLLLFVQILFTLEVDVSLEEIFYEGSFRGEFLRGLHELFIGMGIMND